MESAIALHELCKQFQTPEKQFYALDKVSLTVEHGEIYGIIGMSGAGKSTLVRCINLLETPDSGDVQVNGVNLLSLSPQALRQARTQMGMIFQQFHLLMQSTVLENVCFPLSIIGMGKKEAKVRAKELLQIVGLSDKENAYPAQLSGGQKQRVAIARALAANPKILLCDEATSALDNATTREILELLRQINKNLGVTIVLITHEMSVVEQICNRASVMEQGKIVETSDVKTLFTAPKSAAAKRLILAKETAPEPLTIDPGANRYRLVFDGSVSKEPIISYMILHLGVTVNILHANLQEVGGFNYGQMVVEFPPDEALCEKALAYLREKEVSVERLCAA